MSTPSREQAPAPDAKPIPFLDDQGKPLPVVQRDDLVFGWKDERQPDKAPTSKAALLEWLETWIKRVGIFEAIYRRGGPLEGRYDEATIQELESNQEAAPEALLAAALAHARRLHVDHDVEASGNPLEGLWLLRAAILGDRLPVPQTPGQESTLEAIDTSADVPTPSVDVAAEEPMAPPGDETLSPNDGHAPGDRPGRSDGGAPPTPTIEMTEVDAIQELKKKGASTKAALVEFMLERTSASFDDVAQHVHGDNTTSDGTIRTNASKTNDFLVEFGVPIKFTTGSGCVFKVKA